MSAAAAPADQSGAAPPGLSSWRLPAASSLHPAEGAPASGPKKPPIRSCSAAGEGGQRCCSGWAPRRVAARKGPSRWAPSRRQRPGRWAARAWRSTARASRRGSTAQVTRVGQIASTPSRQSSSSNSSSRGRSAAVSSGKARPRPPLICRSTPAGLSQSPCQSMPAARLPGGIRCRAAMRPCPSIATRQSRSRRSSSAGPSSPRSLRSGWPQAPLSGSRTWLSQVRPGRSGSGGPWREGSMADGSGGRMPSSPPSCRGCRRSRQLAAEWRGRRSGRSGRGRDHGQRFRSAHDAAGRGAA